MDVEKLNRYYQDLTATKTATAVYEMMTGTTGPSGMDLPSRTPYDVISFEVEGSYAPDGYATGVLSEYVVIMRGGRYL